MELRKVNKYRSEIDGLRSIAVLSVVVYHLQIPFGAGHFLHGGFLGVDVFFVISGFLITQIILIELDKTQRFNLWNFYVRRARRILPALLLVIITSIVASYFILLPSELERFASSIVATLGFFSNIFWFLELGEYGAQSGLLQPLLHTWSLAIEEQFYLFFPLLLMVLPKRRPVLLTAILGGFLMLSLILAQATTLWNQEISFFSPISRAWELLTGSVIALVKIHFAQPRLMIGKLARMAPKLALVVLFGCVSTINLPQIAHPGFITLPAVLATAALLLWCQPGEAVTDFLSLRPMVYIGKLSYSIYLWHFPVFAFGRLTEVDAIGPADMALWLVLTLTLSVIGYYLIERPFRARVSSLTFVGSLVTAVAVTLAFVGAVRFANGFTGERAKELAAIYGENEFDNELLRDLSWQPLSKLTGLEEISTINAARPSIAERESLLFTDTEALNVLLIGNSHSKDMFNALYLNTDAFPRMGFARFGMASGFSQAQRELLFAAPNFSEAEIIMIAPRYARQDLSVLPDFIDELKSRGKAVVLVGNTAQFISPSSLPLFDWLIQRERTTPASSNLNQIAYEFEENDVRRRNVELRTIAERHGALFLSRRDLVCNDALRECALVTPNGSKTMYDDAHWTIDGATHFGVAASRQNWLRSLLALESPK